MNSSSRAFAIYNQNNLTNASFKWQHGSSVLQDPGSCVASVMLARPKPGFAVIAMLGISGNGLRAGFMHFAGNKVFNTQSMPVSVRAGEFVHLELDIDPNTSNVVFWVNDKGMDMGVIPGYVGGAARVRWMVAGNSQEMPDGKLTDCAVATSAGWKAAALRQDHINRDYLHPDHTFDIVSHNSISFGNRRFAA